MYEVEVKVRAEHAPVRDRLSAAGADHVERVRQEDTYYDAPHRDFAATDEALRLRRETRVPIASGGGTDGRSSGETASDDGGAVPDAETAVRVTYKGPLVDESSKTREEHEAGVCDPESMEGVLDGLGFAPAATVEKSRDRYRLDGYTVTLDAVDGLGEFVEVESEASAEADVDDVREGAFDVLRDVGLDPSDQLRTSYLGMLLSEDDV
jgi:adenylate cyclase class 2